MTIDYTDVQRSEQESCEAAELEHHWRQLELQEMKAIAESAQETLREIREYEDANRV